MKRIVWQLAVLPVLFAAAAGAAASAQSAAAPLSSASTALVARAGAVADSVKSYTASVHADIAMHSFPYLSPSLDGTYYHKEPSLNKIVFTSGLPFIAKQFSKIYPEIESPSRWPQVYDMSTESDANGVTTLRLVPKKRGRVDHIDAAIEDKTAQVVSMRWNYSDGGYALLKQTYSNVQGHLLVTAQSGHFEVPHYDADLTSRFSNFKLNAQIPDSVFAQN